MFINTFFIKLLCFKYCFADERELLYRNLIKCIQIKKKHNMYRILKEYPIFRLRGAKHESESREPPFCSPIHGWHKTFRKIYKFLSTYT